MANEKTISMVPWMKCPAKKLRDESDEHTYNLMGWGGKGFVHQQLGRGETAKVKCGACGGEAEVVLHVLTYPPVK
jgi:hypothetical protein